MEWDLAKVQETFLAEMAKLKRTCPGDQTNHKKLGGKSKALKHRCHVGS